MAIRVIDIPEYTTLWQRARALHRVGAATCTACETAHPSDFALPWILTLKHFRNKHKSTSPRRCGFRRIMTPFPLLVITNYTNPTYTPVTLYFPQMHHPIQHPLLLTAGKTFPLPAHLYSQLEQTLLAHQSTHPSEETPVFLEFTHKKLTYYVWLIPPHAPTLPVRNIVSLPGNTSVA